MPDWATVDGAGLLRALRAGTSWLERNVAAVAHNAIRTVYFAIEQAFALRPVAVNVHVHGLRFSGEQRERSQ